MRRLRAGGAISGRARGAATRATRRFAERTFPVWERLGLHLTPVHFYQPIPDTRTLGDAPWRGLSDLPGVDMNEDGQERLLDRLEDAWKHEYDAFPLKPGGDGGYHVDNGMFESVDGEILYSMLRETRPARIVEVGSGYSTLAAGAAIARNCRDDPGYDCRYRVIDPYPNESLAARFSGFASLVREPVQRVPLEEFEALREGDVLFIDSSHVAAVGSDVCYEYLEVLPRLRPGVLVHLHDIFLPAEYPEEWVRRRHLFWNEQYVLQAFLAFNGGYEVVWAASFMHLRHPARLERAFRSYRRGERWPGSCWLRRR